MSAYHLLTKGGACPNGFVFAGNAPLAINIANASGADGMGPTIVDLSNCTIIEANVIKGMGRMKRLLFMAGAGRVGQAAASPT